MKILDGNIASEEIKKDIRKTVSDIIEKGGRAPHIAAVLVGEDAPSQTYVRNKEKAANYVGFIPSIYRYPDTITEKELLDVVKFLNDDDDIDGFIVQLPLPAHVNENKIIEAINPDKDIDGFHPINIGKMVLGIPAFLPATPYGIIKLLEYYKIETEGKHCVVVGRSNIVGTPVSLLLSRKSNPGNCTVTICHSKTPNIKELTLQADILIVAIRQLEFITGDMVKEGSVIIDVGYHRVDSTKTKSGYKIKGDVNFEEVSKKCSYITTVPGGVGPMTIVSLLLNGLDAAKRNSSS